MELGGKTIEDWLLSMPPAKFPNGMDYPAFLRLVKGYLVTHVYPQVNAAAIFQAASSSPNQAVYLNDHGRDHVNMVLSRASQMLSHTSAELSAYECFILVMAIYIHDIGNFLADWVMKRKWFRSPGI